MPSPLTSAYRARGIGASGLGFKGDHEGPAGSTLRASEYLTLDTQRVNAKFIPNPKTARRLSIPDAIATNTLSHTSVLRPAPPFLAPLELPSWFRV